MTSNLVLSAVRQSNRKRIIWCSLGLVVLALVGAFTMRYYINFFSGPRAISHSDLIQITNPDAEDRYYVSVDGDRAIDTGAEMVRRSRTGSSSVSASFVALAVDDRLLLVKTGGDVPALDDLIPTHYEGALTTFPSDVQEKIIDKLGAQDAELKEMFLPYMLDATNFRTGGIIGLVVMVPLLLLLVFLLVRAIQRSGDPTRHPFVQSLKRLGDPSAVASEIEAEMQAEHTQVGKVHVTRNWVVVSDKALFQAVRLSDMVWLYKQVTQHKTNGITTGRTYVANLFDSHGEKVQITGPEETVEQVLGRVYTAAPWAIAGYSADLEKAWNKDRASLLAAVAQRRQQTTAV
jgi:hypothetical protein